MTYVHRNHMTLLHGGQLEQIAQQYNIPLDHWLDVSTGIAPISYPIPALPVNIWQRLPQKSPELIAAAKQYYQCSQLIITNGSQAIIKALPTLYRQKNVLGNDVYLPERGYKEHAHAWQLAGYTVHFYQTLLPEMNDLLPNSVLVIINPNNPTGQFFNKRVIDKYQQQLKRLNGLLVLDEAFIDVMPDNESYCSNIASGIDDKNTTQNFTQIGNSHCLVLRSFGKFFGLAGIRIGFLVADSFWCQAFESVLGPWQVNGPAQVIAEHALKDTQWQQTQKETLHQLKVAQALMFAQVFPNTVLQSSHGCDLFITLHFHHQETAKKLYHLLCQQGVYCRLSDEQDTLRFGITTQALLPRLAAACEQACKLLLTPIKSVTTL